MGTSPPSRLQQTALVLLRTLVGWHFLYEGFVKLLWPAWTRAGVPLGRFSSVGYLRSSTGPLADLFRALADASWLPWIDLLMAWSLLLVGLALMLGLFTQLACAGAIALLALFYLSWLPTRGVYEPGTEGNYLLVNKNLVEAAAVFVVLVFRTGRIAGLDLLLARPRAGAAPVAEA
ncbi:MAG TPA: DoxX subfamily [Vicinamibacteria bacterium]|nr:DoxX subfamily [Vicinamibacteria bacterium]